MKHYLFMLKCLIASLINSGGGGYEEREEYIINFVESFDIISGYYGTYQELAINKDSYSKATYPYRLIIQSEITLPSLPPTNSRYINSYHFYTYPLPAGDYNIMHDSPDEARGVGSVYAYCKVFNKDGTVTDYPSLNTYKQRHTRKVTVEDGAIIMGYINATMTGTNINYSAGVSVKKVG